MTDASVAFTVDAILEAGYAANDAAVAADDAEIAEEDQRRLVLLKNFADAKVLVTALRALQQKSGNRLQASFRESMQGDVTVEIKDFRVSDRLRSINGTRDDQHHGFVLMINPQGTVLKRIADIGSMYGGVDVKPEYMHQTVHGAVPALTHLAIWAGETSDEAGRRYLQRPNVIVRAPQEATPKPN